MRSRAETSDGRRSRQLAHAARVGFDDDLKRNDLVAGAKDANRASVPRRSCARSAGWFRASRSTFSPSLTAQTRRTPALRLAGADQHGEREHRARHVLSIMSSSVPDEPAGVKSGPAACGIHPSRFAMSRSTVLLGRCLTMKCSRRWASRRSVSGVARSSGPCKPPYRGSSLSPLLPRSTAGSARC